MSSNFLANSNSDSDNGSRKSYSSLSHARCLDSFMRSGDKGKTLDLGLDFLRNGAEVLDFVRMTAP